MHHARQKAKQTNPWRTVWNCGQDSRTQAAPIPANRNAHPTAATAWDSLEVQVVRDNNNHKETNTASTRKQPKSTDPRPQRWSFGTKPLSLAVSEIFNGECDEMVDMTSICLCTDTSITKLLGTWWTTAHQYPTSPIVNGYVLPVVMKSLYHVTGSVPMDVGHLPLLARLSGTCPRTYGIRRFLWTVTDSFWKLFLFAQY